MKTQMHCSIPFVVLALVLAAGCSGGNDAMESGNQGGAGFGGAAGSATTGGATAGGATAGGATAGGAQGAAGASGGAAPAVDECDAIVGLDVNGECDSTAVEARVRQVNMLLVMDKSTSMRFAFDTPPGSAAGGAGGAEGRGGAGGGSAVAATRWDTLIAALDAAMTATDSRVEYGLLLYPSGADCAVASDPQIAIGRGDATARSILAALEDSPPDVAGTPMAAALEAAFSYFTEGDGSDLSGERFVLLATDGGPNCNEALTCDADECTLNLEDACPVSNCCAIQPDACVDEVAVTERIAALREAGVDTFVVGIPGSEFYASSLRAFADAGGRNPEGVPGTYYEVSGDEGAAGLAETFERIALQLVTDCVIPVESVPDVGQVNVAIDCVVLPKNGDTSSWAFNDDFTQIVIEGERCEEIRTTGVDRLDVVFGCPVIR